MRLCVRVRRGFCELLDNNILLIDYPPDVAHLVSWQGCQDHGGSAVVLLTLYYLAVLGS